jgi:hypothetical protein
MQRTLLGTDGRCDIDRDLGPVAAAVAECPGFPGMSEPHHEGPLQEFQPLLPGSRHANIAHPGAEGGDFPPMRGSYCRNRRLMAVANEVRASLPAAD